MVFSGAPCQLGSDLGYKRVFATHPFPMGLSTYTLPFTVWCAHSTEQQACYQELCSRG